ncbi:MAG TPA: thiamine pyrophosphate-dependent enzyme [Methanospirillum sp.]|nr:thiamine pyrophosphate-dependent enzyme [Methanospirillum sp.]
MKIVEMVSTSIQACADRIYAVPGYPVNELVHLCGANLVINEKVALELALGDSLASRRACVIVKHVGMNALVDPLVHATFQGLQAGVVIICGDDPFAKNTLTVQDSRTFGPVAQIPVFDQITGDTVKSAFDASEEYSRVALIRITAEDITKQTSTSLYNRTSNLAMRHEPGRLANPDLTLYGRAVLASKSTSKLSDAGLAPLRNPPFLSSSLPVRRSERGSTLSLCRNCEFRILYELMRDGGLSAICDTGCSLIAMNHPFSFGVASYGMGSAIAVAATSTQVALIGDYGILHSGLQGLIEVYEKKIPLLCVVMVNRCMGMTGGQPTPDPAPYLTFAQPVRCDAHDRETLKRLLTIPARPTTLLVYGHCPEVINHETVAC